MGLRAPTLFHRVTAWHNLLLAFRRAAHGKRGRPNVAAFEYRLEDELDRLRAELVDQTYQPGAYKNFFIHEPKRRLISAAPFRDRVVHHALCNVIEPILQRSFIFDSYANRIGKGTHRALDRAQYFSRRYRYALQCDLRQFFPSIDHAILKDEITGKLPDRSVLWLIDRILLSGVDVLTEQYQMVYFPGDDLFAVNRPRGLPIGNLTSQCWANVYLNSFDHFVKRHLRCKAYLRYVDDLMLFSNDKCQLREWHARIVERLAHLRLTAHPGAHARPVTEGLPWLGFIIHPEWRRLKRRKGIHFRRRLKRLIGAAESGTGAWARVVTSVQAWQNHVGYANTRGLQRAVLAPLAARCQSQLGSRRRFR